MKKKKIAISIIAIGLMASLAAYPYKEPAVKTMTTPEESVKEQEQKNKPQGGNEEENGKIVNNFHIQQEGEATGEEGNGEENGSTPLPIVGDLIINEEGILEINPMAPSISEQLGYDKMTPEEREEALKKAEDALKEAGDKTVEEILAERGAEEGKEEHGGEEGKGTEEQGAEEGKGEEEQGGKGSSDDTSSKGNSGTGGKKHTAEEIQKILEDLGFTPGSERREGRAGDISGKDLPTINW